MGSRIAILAEVGFAVGLAYGGALLALDIAGVGSLLRHDGPAAVPIVLAGAALSFIPVVLVTGLATLPNVKR